MLDPEMLVPETVRPLSRREYEQLVELGAFADERVELLHGVLVTMSPQGAPHAGITAWFAQRLIRSLDLSHEVRSHSPFAASDDSEPEPDVSVSISPSRTEHPATALLLIEVSESSLRKDRAIKMPLYAKAGVPEYWVVDVGSAEVEVYTSPTATGYTRVERFRRDSVLRPTKLPGVTIAVDEIPWP